MRRRRDSEKEERRMAKEERGGQPVTGGGVGVKAEQGEVVVPEGCDGDGEGGEDGKGDEVQVQPAPPPTTCFTPSRVAAKGPRERLKQPLPPGLPNSLNRAVGQTNQLFFDASKGHYTLRWVMRPLFRCLIRKKGEGKGEWQRDAAKGVPGTGT